MKFMRFTLAFAVVSLALFGAASPALADAGTVDPQNCALSAWSPELFSFFGDKATVLAKFQALDRNLLKHRTFAFIVETNRGAKLTFFELEGKIADGTRMDLGSASGKSISGLSQQITTALLNNSGEKCAGMLTKELLAGYSMDHSMVPRPATPGEAFQYALALADGEYVQATFILLC